mmetsp:Transcript_62857/g.113139  ORF Transcript_62857/g.113139 Transcript_62857/m.113139 type:complete len:279 (-) Transcript_62857:170-1006(-)
MMSSYALQQMDETEEIMLQDEESLTEEELPSGNWQARRFAARGILATAAVLGLVVVVARSPSNLKVNSHVSAGLKDKQSLYSGGWGSLSSAAPVDPSQITSVNQLTGGTKNAKPVAYAPPENMHDGNKCEDDEEFFENLCYKKCSLLTNGGSSVRTSGLSCATGKTATEIAKAVKKFAMPCHGFDTAGDMAGGGCPHAAGACLADEEFHLGTCFKKCSLLTGGVFPYRTTPEACCKEKASFSCMKPGQSNLKSAYAVGGGTAAMAVPHIPETSLTEAR